MFIRNWKLFLESYPNSLGELNDMIDSIMDMLVELVDDGWFVRVDYTPKRFESEVNGILSDYIGVMIKRKKSGIVSRYSVDSFFNWSDVEDYVCRIRDSYPNKDICYEVIIPSGNSYSGYGVIVGDFKSVTFDELVDLGNSGVLLGIFLEIYLGGVNVDGFNYGDVVSY